MPFSSMIPENCELFLIAADLFYWHTPFEDAMFELLFPPITDRLSAVLLRKLLSFICVVFFFFGSMFGNLDRLSLCKFLPFTL
jgi:hypothetical protein